MKDELEDNTKQERADRVMELQESISADLNEAKVGRTFKVLIDRTEGGNYIGRTEYDSPEVDNEVVIDSGSQHLRIGDFADIIITKSTPFDLYGNPA